MREAARRAAHVPPARRPAQARTGNLARHAIMDHQILQATARGRYHQVQLVRGVAVQVEAKRALVEQRAGICERWRPGCAGGDGPGIAPDERAPVLPPPTLDGTVIADRRHFEVLDGVADERREVRLSNRGAHVPTVPEPVWTVPGKARRVVVPPEVGQSAVGPGNDDLEVAVGSRSALDEEAAQR